MKRIILGSASPRRRELMEHMGIPFEIITSDGEERYTASVPEQVVQELALAKAENVAAKIKKQGTAADMVVIGADTIVVFDGEILGKPEDEADAFRMLNRLQGQTHQVFTGVALLDFDENAEKMTTTAAVETKVFVHQMTEEEIRCYISTKEPMDKAGAYGIQGKFAVYIDRIEGDYFNVVGLPVSYVYQQLKKICG